MVLGILVAGSLGHVVTQIIGSSDIFKIPLAEGEIPVDTSSQAELDRRGIPLTINPRLYYPNSAKITRDEIVDYYHTHWLSYIPEGEYVNLCHTPQKLTNPHKIAEKLISGIELLTLDELQEQLAYCLNDIYNRPSINVDNYSCIFVPEKSSQWIASLAVTTELIPLPQTWLPLTILGDSKHEDYSAIFDENIKKLTPNSTVIYFDDVSYSGTQVLLLLDEIVERILIKEEITAKAAPKNFEADTELEENMETGSTTSFSSTTSVKSEAAASKGWGDGELSSLGSLPGSVGTTGTYRSEASSRDIHTDDVVFRGELTTIVLIIPFLSNRAFQDIMTKLNAIAEFAGERHALCFELITSKHRIKNVKDILDGEEEMSYLRDLKLIGDSENGTMTFTEWKVPSRYVSIVKTMVNPDLQNECEDLVDVNPPYKSKPVNPSLIT
jgi:hypothetical protein